MKVTGPGSTSTGQTRRTDRAQGRGGDFARHLQDAVGTGATPLVEGPSPLAGVDALLAAQVAGGATDEEARRRATRHGEDILDRLEEIRLGLLTGGLSRERLIDLARMVRSRRDQIGDPRLAAILDEIELRAEVELAKYARRG